ncbi:type I polyketide synthase [Actinokineospora pegani]|uniref:type I polyketide synthase n=1 Tax=Actinokineospora pegani TaxID=2654637 RepID=UPI0012EA6C11|nr:type I polyketide synthase [Actinokineospora pegani]
MSTPLDRDPAAVRAELRRIVAGLTGLAPDAVPTDRPLRELGVDSAGVTSVLAGVAGWTGTALPASAAWRYPTVDALAAALCGEGAHGGDGQAPAGPTDPSEPVAIVGIGCRLPGGIEGPAGFWSALRAGVDAVGEVPADRWDADAWTDPDPAAPGRVVTRAGGFLDDVAGFDADLFGVSPAEARHMDPQQRLALEVTWAALEDAGLAPRSLSGTRTGVFLGTMSQEYHLATGADPEAIGSHSAVGWDPSVIPARVAYALDLRGPVLSVATACSSSLTALHLAVQSLRRGESDLALAGGVNLLLHPHTSVAMTKFGGLSADGRCRAFAADASGYVRAEGIGVVVVRRLSDALRDGDRVYAVVRGTAVNSDGASNGITAPNPAAQVAVVRAALRDAGVRPDQVSYVEAHGTGTPLGDPIEADALGEVFAPGRDRALLLGSAKTNVGHLEPAAGITGVIKAALAVHHGELPASLHFTDPNPRIDFAANRLEVVTGARPWPDAERVTGVSGFGFGGANAHAVLCAPPAPRRLLAAVAAADTAALAAAVAELAAEDDPFAAGPVRVVGSGPARAFAVVEHADDLADALAGALNTPAPADRVAFFFSGHGAQWPGMAVDLLAEPAFAAALRQVDHEVAAHTGWSVLDELLGAGDRLDRAEVVQPVLFAVHVATAALLRSWGVAPDVVLGQSIGEVAAAVVSGALTTAEGARVITTWSALVAARVGGLGGVTAVELGHAQAAEWAAEHAPALAVAAHLGAGHTALAGPLDALAAAEARLAEAGTAARRVRIDYAAHGPDLGALAAEVATALADVRGAAAEVPIVSTATGAALPGAAVDGAHWARNTTSPMLVAEAVAALTADGPVTVVEVSPHPVAARPLAGLPGVEAVLPTGGRGRPARWALEELVGALWTAGAPVDWSAVAGAGATRSGPVPIVVSGKTPQALAANAARLADALDTPGAPAVADVAFTAATTRAALDHRAAVVAADPAEAVAALRELAAGTATTSPARGGTAFLFTGQGSQRPGMGAGLRAAHPVFRAAHDEVLAALDRHLPVPLAEAAAGEDVHRTEFAQPALFAHQVALSRLWASWGVRPEVVTGHSVGELTAAHVAGALSLDDAARLVVARGALMQACRADGAMASVRATEEQVLAALVPGAALAAVNAPDQCVVSGDADAVDAVAAVFSARGKRVKRLVVSHAFHSHHMDSALGAFAEVAASCAIAAPRVPLVSSVTGERFGPDLPEGRGLRDPGYWVRQVRDAVRFADALTGLGEVGSCLEIGPAAVLAVLAPDSLPAGRAVVASVRADRDEAAGLAAAVGALHGAGAALDWAALLPGARRVDLPTYCFQHTRYWLDGAARTAPGGADDELWSAVAAGAVDRVAALLDLPADAPRTLAELMPHLAGWRAGQADRAAVARHAHEVHWRPSPATALAGRRLVVALPGGDTAPITGLLRESGVDVVTAPGPDVVGVLAVAGPGADPAAGVYTGAVAGLLRDLAESGVDAPVRVVTTGAARCGATDPAPDPAQAALLGIGQVVALEHPGRWAGLLDLPADPGADQLAALLADDGEDAAVRGGVRLVRRIRRTAPTTTPWRPRGTVLITGGTGALAAHTARLLAGRGAEHLVLASRRGGDADGARALAEELAAAGVRVSLARCDVTDPAAVAALVAELARADVPLRAVVHTAGVVDDRLLADIDPAAPSSAAPAKVGGALALDAATRGVELDAFVLFSSVVGVVGNVGQADYAGANAAVDAVAAARAAADLPVSCVAWGAWGGPGMADGRVGEHLRGLGLRPMPVARGLLGLDAALAVPGHLVFADLDWPAVAAALGPRPLWADLPEARIAETPAEGGLRAELSALPAADRDRALRALVATEAAAVLGLADATGLDHRRGFRDLGFDSMMGVDFAGRVAARAGVAAPRTLSFDHPDVAAVADWLAGELDLAAPERAGAVVLAAADDDPVAVVGVGLRMPGGAHDLDSLWAVLAEGRDTLRELGADRFDPALLEDPVVAAEGRPVVRQASLLDDVAGFDAGFFGISPREAEPMDPQHRLLLEVAWEALENACLRPDLLRESQTGVFVGAGPGEYGTHRAERDRDTYALTGTLPSFAAGRIAYHLGLQGPALAVDTACSSSLVAVHLAAEAVRTGQCATAIAGGVQVLADPAAFTALNRSRALAPDGRGKAFAAAADGYGRGEGVGVLVLTRLSTARERGLPVLGLLPGTAVNHDGASSGITAPNGTAQQRVLRQALAAAGVEPSGVDYVECHGTGTALGDPIEVRALAEVYGAGRAEPLALGTAKSVIGHLESAAGVAGVCKVLAALRHGALPATPRSTPLNPALDWDGLPVRVLTGTEPWAAGERVRRAGVSSFGLSGTNAHVIVAEAPAVEETATAPIAPVLPLVLSARDGAALRAQADRWAGWLRARPDADWAAVVRAAAARTPLAHRAAVLVDGPAAAADALAALAAGGAHADVITGVAADQGRVAFVFPGQGAQWVGMARELLAGSTAFAEVIARCDAAFGWSLTARLSGDEPLDRVEVVQPLLFAVGLGLVAVWGELGVRPEAVVGHSQGEVVAAVVAGALSLEDAAVVVTARSSAVATVTGGGMALVEAPVDWVTERLADGVGVAAANTPGSTVVSGMADAVDAFVARVEAEGVFCRRVAVDYASHSAQMDPLLPGLRAGLAGVTGAAATLPFHSSVAGRPLDGTELDGGYWARNLREPVRFDRALAGLLDSGATVFVEAAPHPVLGISITDAVAERGGVVVGSLARGRGGIAEVLGNLARLHVAGHPVDWTPVLGAGPRAELPPYAFQHQRYWSAPSAAGDARALGLAEAGHPWLRAATPLAQGGDLFTGRVDPATDPWLADHRVFGEVLVPGTGLVDLVRSACASVGLDAVAQVELAAPLVLTGPVRVQVAVAEPAEDGTRQATVHSRPETGRGRWTRHATATLAAAAAAEPFPAIELDGAQVDTDALRADFAARGVDYGPAFTGLLHVAVVDGAAHGVARLPDGLSAAGYGLHPALLDAALHACAAVADPADPAEGALLPVRWSGVRLLAAEATRVRVRATVADEPGGRRASVWVTDLAGAPVARIEELYLHRATADQVRAARRGAEGLHRVDYRPVGSATASGPGGRTVVVGDAGLAASLGAQHVADVASVPADAERVVLAAPNRDAARWTLASITALLGDARFDRAALAWVTRDTAPVGGGRGTAHGPVAGLVRVARSEHPDRDLRLVDLPPGEDTGLPAALASAEPELAVRGGELLAPRLATAPAPTQGPGVDTTGTVVLTGGTGELGAAVARHLVAAHGADDLLLLSRRGPDAPGAADLLADLRAAGASARALAVDVSDRGALTAALAGRAVSTVVHLAGVLDDGLLVGRDPAALDRALAPKAAAVEALAELLPDAALVLFSSAAGVFGTAGQGVYAAANTAMDAVAEALRADGRAVVDLAWGLWEQSGVGMTAHLGSAELARMRAQGVAPLPVADGLALLDAALRAGPGRYVPVLLDTRGLGERVPPLLRGLVRPAVPKAAAPAAAPAARSLRDDLLAKAPGRRLAAATSAVRAEVAAVLGLPAAEVDEAAVLKQLGLDSLMAVELRRRLSALSGLTLPATLAFDHPTPAAVARLLLDRLDLAPVEEAAPAAAEPAPVLVAAAPSGGSRSVADLNAELDAFLASAGLDQ